MKRSSLITLKWIAIFVLSIIISGCVEDPTKRWKPTEIFIGEQLLNEEHFKNYELYRAN